MRMVIAALAVGLAGCSQPVTDKAANNGAAATAAAAKQARAPYCFFKDSETKGWAASTDAKGNVVVKGKAFREDSRYQAVLGAPSVAGTTAEVRPTIITNTTGFASPDNWWDVTATIPDSAAVDKVLVKCGDKTVAELAVRRRG